MEIQTLTELRQRVREALREQHPEWIESDGRSPICDSYDVRFAWLLVVTVGQPGDPTSDATIPWPADRPQIDVGTLVIDRVESEAESPARDMNFDPTILPDGIAVSDDPLLSARSAAYSVSFTRREGEPKEPSAVSTAEVEK